MLLILRKRHGHGVGALWHRHLIAALIVIPVLIGRPLVLALLLVRILIGSTSSSSLRWSLLVGRHNVLATKVIVWSSGRGHKRSASSSIGLVVDNAATAAAKLLLLLTLHLERLIHRWIELLLLLVFRVDELRCIGGRMWLLGYEFLVLWLLLRLLLLQTSRQVRGGLESCGGRE